MIDDVSTSTEPSLDSSGSSSTNNPSMHTSDRETGNVKRNSPAAHDVHGGIAQKPSQDPQSGRQSLITIRFAST